MNLPFFSYYNRKFTLLEISMVMVILAVTTGLVIRYQMDALRFGPTDKTIPQIVTENRMRPLFTAIMGGETQAGYYQDMGQNPEKMPRQICDLFMVPSHLDEKSKNFNSRTRKGWNGPYLHTSSNSYGLKTKSGFQFRPGFGAKYGNASDPCVLDGWGNPIVLQIELDHLTGISETEAKYARLVSAGPNGILETPTGPGNIFPGGNSSKELTLEKCGDDILLFLQVADTRK